MAKERALIVGVGDGLSASLARLFHREGMALALAARDTNKLAGLAEETGAKVYACDAADRGDVASLFDALERDGLTPDLAVYNPSFRVRGPFVELDQEAVEKTLMVCAYGAFLVGQHAAQRMLKAGHGTILFTGASAGVKGYARSAPFAMGKFALRGLAQSMARELHPRNRWRDTTNHRGLGRLCHRFSIHLQSSLGQCAAHRSRGKWLEWCDRGQRWILAPCGRRL